MRSLTSVAFAATLLLLLAAVVGATVRTPVSSSLPDCFISMGDWGFNDPHVAAMATNMAAVTASPAQYGCNSVRMSLALGDNFYNSGVESVTDPKWDEVWVNQFRNKAPLRNMTFLPTMGDHDYAQLNHDQAPNFTRAQAQIQYHYERDAQWYLPAANYTYRQSFAGGRTVLFVMINTEALYACIHLRPEWCFQADHAAWIEAVLAKADNDTTIDAVVIGGHHAVVCPLGGHYDPKLDAVLVPIARRHRVSLILTGHSHFVAWSREGDLSTGDYDAGDLWYIINGAGRGAGPYHCWWTGLDMPVARPIDKRCFPFSLSTDGAFLLHRVTSDGFEHCVVDSINGSIVDCQKAPFRKPGAPPTPSPQPPLPPGDACGACTPQQCTTVGCPSVDPYVCLAGAAHGGCSPAPWQTGSGKACTSCCDSSSC